MLYAPKSTNISNIFAAYLVPKYIIMAYKSYQQKVGIVPITLKEQTIPLNDCVSVSQGGTIDGDTTESQLSCHLCEARSKHRLDAG